MHFTSFCIYKVKFNVFQIWFLKLQVKFLKNFILFENAEQSKPCSCHLFLKGSSLRQLHVTNLL